LLNEIIVLGTLGMKTVLVTGGNKGIGLEVTKYFLYQNFRVVIIARDFSKFDLLEHERVSILEYDLSEIAGIPDLISTIGNIDVLINNAGMLFSLPYDAYPLEKIEYIIRLNIESPVALIRAVSKIMIQNGKGRIVNNASRAGQIGHYDIWYGITKAGLINVTKSFSRILGPKGILINAVAPGPVETNMIMPSDKWKSAFKKTVISGRLASAQEVAETIGWLGTSSPEYINGTCIDINNGSFSR
jgi:NAD(P)-dependent dehydrogenase (short-subunit alcohol dehydrogenase family)